MQMMRFLKLIQVILQSCWLRLRYHRQIVICCMGNPSSIGGTELQFRLILNELKQRGMTQVCITTGLIDIDNQSITQICGMGIKHISLGNLLNESSKHNSIITTLIGLVLKLLGGSIIHIFNPTCSELIAAAKGSGLRVVYMETGQPSINDTFWYPIKTYIKDIDYVISVSMSALSNLRVEFGYDGPAKVIHSMIEPPPIGCRARRPQNNNFHIVYCGRLAKLKGLNYLIDAFAIVHQTYPFIRLTLVGDGDECKSLKQQVYERNLVSCVDFKGFLSQDLFFSQLEQADLFCLPSMSEGRPCSIEVAMSIGLAVIATDVGGVPEIVINRQTGLLVKPGDIASLAKAISELIQFPELRMALADRAFANYQAKQNMNNPLLELLDVYKAVHA